MKSNAVEAFDLWSRELQVHESAMQQGFIAGLDDEDYTLRGLGLQDTPNPYTAGTTMATAWFLGYDVARRIGAKIG